MPNYSYISKNLKGETKKGILQAKDKPSLARILKKKDLILINAELEGSNKKKGLSINIPFFSGVSLKEKLIFTRNLQIMIDSGLSLTKSLEALSFQVSNEKFKEALLNIKKEVTEGKSFSDSIEKYPNIFSELFLNMIRVGEEAGTLKDVLTILSEHMEKENELKTKIQGAMVYPVIIIGAMIGIGIIMLVSVIPTLSKTFDELGIELPVTTKVVIGISLFVIEKWYIIILLLIVLASLFLFGVKTKKGKEIIDGFLLKIPIVSPIIKRTNSAFTTRTLGSLISSGIPIVRCLEITSRTLGNVYYKQALLSACEKVKKGEMLSTALRPYESLYPLNLSRIIAVGEETGKTDEVLIKLAGFFEEEVEAATKNLVSAIEPILMIVIGAIIGFFAVSMVQPMYSMLGSV